MSICYHKTMFEKTKNRVEAEIKRFAETLESKYSLRSISPLLCDNINEYITRKGKKVRPLLFLIGYMGFAKKIPAGLYRTSISLEFLHDFLLVHDDIIDKSETRRGLPSMHVILDNYLKKYKRPKFNGQDLAIVVGDVMYAMALHAFLSVKEHPENKEAALKKLIEAAMLTGGGEFAELLAGLEDIAKVTKADIYKIYDLKTANYTFAAPLTIGATLAGVKEAQIRILYKYGIYLGRAFQIKDDIIGIFNDEAETGKPNLTDIREGKKTILIWYAYRNSTKRVRDAIKRIFTKKKAGLKDLEKIRSVIRESGAIDYAKKEVKELIRKADENLRFSSMKPAYKENLKSYTKELLSL